MSLTRSQLKIVFLVPVLFVLYFSIRIALSYFKPQTTVNIVGVHNPVDNYLYLNGRRLFPYGDGGRNYSSKLNIGVNELVLRGPLIKTSVVKLDGGLIGDKQETEISASEVNPENIVKGIVNNENLKPEGTRYFYNSKAIVSYILDNSKTERSEYTVSDSHVALFLYDLEKGEWKNITDDFIYDTTKYSMGSDVKNYFYELDNE